MNREAARLVEHLRRSGIRDERVLEAIARVPRERFVPPEWRDEAYADHPLPIGEGQTISQPYIVALMTQALDLEPGEKVLEIGTGSGYQTAILAEMGADLYTVELRPSLLEAARRRLEALGYRDIHYRLGDGHLGWPDFAPYDAILVTAAPDEIPPALIEQLAPGGRMVIPVGPTPGYQTLWLILKDRAGEVRRVDLGGVAFVPLVPKEAER